MISSETSALTDILTQEEIDSLLNTASENKKILPQDLLKNASKQQKYPMLEKKMDSFCRYLSRTLRKITQSENIQVNIQSFIFGQLGAYLDTIPNPSIIGFYQIEEWKQSILNVLDFNLSYCLLDITLGGRRGTSAMAVEGRAYTSIEKNILQNILSNLTSDFIKTFKQNFSFENMDTNPKTALIASPGCEILIVRLNIDLDKRNGVMDIAFPVHLLDAVQEDTSNAVDAFSENLAQAVSTVSLELKAVLDKKEIPFKDILSWKVGDVLPLTYFEEKPLDLFCQNTLLFKANLQVHKKIISVQIDKQIIDGG